MLGEILGIGSNIIGGLLGRSGQTSANRANLQIARENREWQERMSNTAYQRATKDLEASGLNRILAIGSPSSTPAGNVATMQNENRALQEGIEGGVHTALAARRQRQELKNMQWAQEKDRSTIELNNKQRAIMIHQADAAQSASRIAANEARLSDYLKNLDAEIYGGKTGKALRYSQLLSTPANSASSILRLLK